MITMVDNLIKRGLCLVNGVVMHWCSGETIDRLLLHCKVAYALWSEVFPMFEIQWVMIKTIYVYHLFYLNKWHWFKKYFFRYMEFGVILLNVAGVSVEGLE